MTLSASAVTIFDMEFHKTKYLHYGFNGLLIITAILVLAALIWGLDKGFDITDEAYYLLGMVPGQETQSTFTALQFVIFSKVLGGLGGVINFRILSLITILFSALVFAWGFFKISQRLYPNHPVLSPITITAGFVSTSFFIVPALALTFSYNVFIQAWMLLTGGLTLYGLSIAERADRQSQLQWTWLGVGALLMVAAWIKPTSALALTLLYLVVSFLWMFPHWKNYGLRVFFPFLVGALIILALLYFPLDAVRPILTTLDSQVLHPGHQPIDLLRSLRDDIVNTLQYLLHYGGLIAVAVILGLLISHQQKQRPWLPWVMAVGLIALLGLIYPVFQDGLIKQRLRLPALNVLITLLIVLIGLIGPSLIVRCHLTLRPHLKAESKELQKIWVGLILLLLPLGAAFGTNNTLLWQIWLHVSPWFGLLLFAFMETQTNDWIWPLGWLLLTFTVTWMWAQWMTTYFLRPYRLEEDRLSQTELLRVRSSRFYGLKVDSLTRSFLEEFDAILSKSKFEPGMGVIALYDMPGLVYLSEGLSPGDPWYLRDEPWADRLIENIWDSKLPRKSALILTNQTVNPVIMNALARPEIDFPDSYRQIGRMIYIDQGHDLIFYERRR